MEMNFIISTFVLISCLMGIIFFIRAIHYCHFIHGISGEETFGDVREKINQYENKLN